ncbi:hypothetical protein ACJMK2_005617 [Sinanodonta woodiana]|uniref:Erythroid differentiation-related factor 1 n=1 Tax=Sinanodonta woodiana TaxID=1069815 RepID=A0ABD3VU48_SINWO
MMDSSETKSKTNSNEMVPVKYGPHIDVHSEAEVLQGSVHVLAQFAPLQLNTDLNIPPSNWLRSTTEVQQYVHNSSRRPTQFSSIQMAFKCPDVIGDVDVISSAENIKKLLKIPFGKTHVSLMVHKIGKSLLIDDFDIHKHLFRQAQANWKWLEDFFLNQMMCVPRGSSRENLHNIGVPRESKSRNSLQDRNMYSKFLYHSVRNEAQSQALQRNDEQQEPLVLSESHSEEEPDRNSPPREILWTFEDIRMLIGTDLPIFCKDSYYVSLRLRDMRTPINVLTGLDYWLDNLMCNVPELAMCFHLNGFVKKYDVIKTEDIPNLPKSSFNPQVVVDIAKNILSFLKTNATKEGHTYWLYKGVNDDVVKLYDLTTLCSDTQGAQDENPFTVPIGMLLFRVARNMWQNQGKRKDATIRTLLESCLFLLNKEIYSEVCALASYMLSDLYIPDSAMQNGWMANPGEDESDDDESVSSFQEENQSNPGPTTEVEVDHLCNKYHQDHCHQLSTIRPITSNIDERCHESLTYIHKGLVCFDLHNAKKKRMESHIVEEQARCNKDEAIPLHYEPLQKKHSVSSEPEDLYIAECKEVVQMCTDDSSRSADWHDVKAKLIRKAAITFYTVAKMTASQNKLRERLRLLKNAFICFCGFRKLLPEKAKENTELMIQILELSADTVLLITKSAQNKEDFDRTLDEISEEESEIVECAMKELDEDEPEFLFEITADKEKNLNSCIMCYQHCIGLAQSIGKGRQDIIRSLMKRLGNAQNEMGVWYMLQAQKLLQSEDVIQHTEEIEKLWKKSSNMIQQGILTFERAADVVNQALLHCNMGRLMRLCALTITSISHCESNPEFSNQERHYFQQAKESYQRALSLLKSDHSQSCGEIADSVNWELSTTYFNMATLMQDYAPLTRHQQEDVEKEVIDLMNKSLNLCACKTEPSLPKHAMYIYRTAIINHRLGSLFNNSLRNQSSEQKRKYHRQLAEQHYERSLKQFKSVDSYTEVHRVQLERVALLDFWLTSQQSPRSRLRTLLLMLNLIGDCQEIIGFLSNLEDEGEVSEEEKDANSGDSKIMEEMKTMTNITESKLQFVLLHLVKWYNSVNKKSKRESAYLEEVKKLYLQSLKWDKSEDILPPFARLRKHWSFLLTLLADVKKFYLKVAQTDHDLHLPVS